MQNEIFTFQNHEIKMQQNIMFYSSQFKLSVKDFTFKIHFNMKINIIKL